MPGESSGAVDSPTSRATAFVRMIAGTPSTRAKYSTENFGRPAENSASDLATTGHSWATLVASIPECTLQPAGDMQLLSWIENTALSTYIRESGLAYPTVLTLHSVGMGFLVGLNAMIDLRILGFAPKVPMASLTGFFPLMFAGFWLNLTTGLLLLAAAATHHLSDPVMYFKFAMIIVGMVLLRQLYTGVFRDHSDPEAEAAAAKRRALAIASLVVWTLAITAGRMTAYTFYRFWTWK